MWVFGIWFLCGFLCNYRLEYSFIFPQLPTPKLHDEESAVENLMKIKEQLVKKD